MQNRACADRTKSKTQPLAMGLLRWRVSTDGAEKTQHKRRVAAIRSATLWDGSVHDSSDPALRPISLYRPRGPSQLTATGKVCRPGGRRPVRLSLPGQRCSTCARFRSARQQRSPPCRSRTCAPPRVAFCRSEHRIPALGWSLIWCTLGRISARSGVPVVTGLLAATACYFSAGGSRKGIDEFPAQARSVVVRKTTSASAPPARKGADHG